LSTHFGTELFLPVTGVFIGIAFYFPTIHQPSAQQVNEVFVIVSNCDAIDKMSVFCRNPALPRPELLTLQKNLIIQAF